MPYHGNFASLFIGTVFVFLVFVDVVDGDVDVVLPVESLGSSRLEL